MNTGSIPLSWGDTGNGIAPIGEKSRIGNNSAGNAVSIDSMTSLDGEVKQNPVRP